MLVLILGVNVVKDAEIMLQDTTLQQAFTVDGFAGYLAPDVINITSGVNYIATVQGPLFHTYNLNARFINAYNPGEVVGVSVTQLSDKFVVELINLLTLPPTIIKRIEYPAPSNYNPHSFRAKACQGGVCILLNFIDPNTLNIQSKIYRIDVSGTSAIVTTVNLNGSPNVELLTSLSHNIIVLHISPPLITDADTLKVFDFNGNSITTHALVNGGNGAKLLGLIFYVNHIGILYTDGNDIVAQRYDLSTNSWSSTLTYTPTIAPSSFNPTGIQGKRLVSLNGVGTAFPEIVAYDVINHSIASAFIYTGVEDVPDLVIGGDSVAVIYDDGLNNKHLVIYDIVGSFTLSQTPFAPTGTIYSVLKYPYNDTSEMLPKVRIVYLAGTNSDSLAFFEVKTNIEFSDTFPINVPISLTPFDMVFFDDNNLYASIYPTGINVFPYIAKLDPSLNLLWKSDTIFSASPYLPSYLYDPLGGSLHSLDKNAGNLTGNTYSVTPNLFKKVFEYNSKAYVVYGDNANNLTVDELDPVNLTVISSNDLGFTVPPVTTVEHSGNYMFISYDNSGQGTVYTYDLANAVLNGPRTFNYETGVSPEIASNFTTDGTNLFYRTNLNHIEKCDLALTTCTSIFVDTLTYGRIVSLVADGTNLFVFTNDVSNEQHYILVYDYNLNLQNSYGPFVGLVTKAMNVNDYLAYTLYTGDPFVGTISYLTFVNKQNPNPSLPDWADVLNDMRIVSTAIHEYSPGQYHIYLGAFDQIYALTYIYRYNATQTTSFDEKISSIRYILKDGKLMIAGNGDVNLKLYDFSGRLIATFKGRIDGMKTVARMNKKGIYVLKLNNQVFKIVNIR